MQALVVALIVSACAVYALWTLMPAAWRRALALRLQDGPWPAPLARHLRRAAAGGTGCACDHAGDCGSTKPPAGPQPIRFHRKPRG